jgi:hypothetical protein
MKNSTSVKRLAIRYVKLGEYTLNLKGADRI